jgi:hypothetical protein
VRTRFVTILVLVTALCGFFSTNGYSYDDAPSRESLRGIKGVYLFVEELGIDAIKDGITRKMIQGDIEYRLHEKNIKLFSEEEYKNKDNIPLLYIQINYLKLNEINSYAYYIDLELVQLVTLNRNKYSKSATTWSVGRIGYINVNKLIETRDQIKDVVDIFIKALVSENPKK